MKNLITSWGNINLSKHYALIYPTSRNQQFKNIKGSCLAIGNMRSYGDEAYNDNGALIDGLSLNKFIEFDRNKGYLVAECGVTLEQILRLIVPCGWFLNVTPGTKFVTLAGAIANDVHGKNHHGNGSFGCFVEELELKRSDGESLICSRTDNSEYFYATIGGLGLTGFIVWAKIKLLPIQNSNMVTRSYKFSNLDHYFELNALLESTSTYTVAWIDCLASGKSLGRGIYYTGEHAGFQEEVVQAKVKKLNMPITPPISLINRLSLLPFNFLYYHRKLPIFPVIQHYSSYFYPLDGVGNWNRMYGHKGFYQYQFVVPSDIAKESIKEILGIIKKNNTGSFLAVLKTFGNIQSGGLLSFSRPGVTLALDFPNQGAKTKQLFKLLDQIVLQAKGAIYPAKDLCMSKELFISGYSNIDKFRKYKDPEFSSNFWRRVGE